jgi:hypothetical protein
VAAAERFGNTYCALAFSEGCSVPEDCGVPTAFEDRSDCRLRLTPLLRACPVPQQQVESVVETLDACTDVLEVATCDEPLCGDGILDTDPCRTAIEDLASFCQYEAL